ncbi:hypothetical protein HK405_007597, partial [Cladochytrium tenue]
LHELIISSQARGRLSWLRNTNYGRVLSNNWLWRHLFPEPSKFVGDKNSNPVADAIVSTQTLADSTDEKENAQSGPDVLAHPATSTPWKSEGGNRAGDLPDWSPVMDASDNCATAS